jgi:cytochrome c-type biogenesis protein CcmH
MKKYAWSIALALLAAALFTGNTLAQEPTPSDDQVNKIAKELYCPVCENTPLDVCPTEACRQWRDLIREQLAAGWTAEQIKQYFAENYGARVLAEPPRQGLNWLVYIIPPAIILAGGLLLFRALRGWMKPGLASTDPVVARGEPRSKKDDYITRLEEEVKKRK